MEISKDKVDSTSIAFEMLGAREIIKLTAGGVNIEHQVKALESAIVENPRLAIDLIRALIESVCITILHDRGLSVTTKHDLPELIKLTLKKLNLPYDNIPNAKKVNESIGKTAQGLANLIQGICELRTLEGFASHGKDAFFQSSLDLAHVHLAARAADALVNFLFKKHQNNLEAHSATRLIYEHHESFNDYINDNTEPVIIFDLRYSPSEILYNLDKEAYRDLLTDYHNQELGDSDRSVSQEQNLSEEISLDCQHTNTEDISIVSIKL